MQNDDTTYVTMEYQHPNDRHGYVWGHWIGCDCDSCRRNRAEHMQRANYGCQCPVCTWWKNKERHEARERQQRMSTVNVCDRCETLVKASALGLLIIASSPEENGDNKEICPGCVEDFLEWYNSYDPAECERPRAYSKAYEPPKSGPDPTEVLAEALAKHLSNDGRELPARTQDKPRTVTHKDNAVWGDDSDDS